MKFKLGRKPRAHNPRIPKLSAIRAGAAPSLPTSVNYAANMPSNLGMALNDSLGDCVEAAATHCLQLWTFNASAGKTMTTPTDAQVETLYELWGGYVPGNPSTDNGTVIQTGLQDWLTNAFDSDTLAAFVEIDVSNVQEIQETIFEAGVAFVGLNVPAFVENLENPGAVWDVNPSADNTIIGGHCVVITGYTQGGNYNFVTWGSPNYQMTPAFFAQFVDEAYMLANGAWIAATGMSPAGLTLAQLETLMQSLAEPQSGTHDHRWHIKRRRRHARNAVS